VSHSRACGHGVLVVPHAAAHSQPAAWVPLASGADRPVQTHMHQLRSQVVEKGPQPVQRWGRQRLQRGKHFNLQTGHGTAGSWCNVKHKVLGKQVARLLAPPHCSAARVGAAAPAAELRQAMGCSSARSAGAGQLLQPSFVLEPRADAHLCQAAGQAVHSLAASLGVGVHALHERGA